VVPTRDRSDIDETIAEQASRFVIRLRSGEAAKADRDACKAWRDADPRHEAAWQEAEAAWAVAADLDQDRTTGLVRPGKPRKKRQTPRKALLLLGAAAAAAALGWSLKDGWHDYSAGTAQVRTVTLPDGSRVTLNARAAVDADFTAGARRVTIARGEVFFEVAPDRSRPFVVATRNTRVVVTGTAFNVRQRLSSADDVEIAVTENAVEVSATAEKAMTPPVRLSAGQQVTVTANSVGPVQPAHADTVLSWRRGELVAEDETLAEVVGELQAYSSGWIVLTAGARNIKVNAVLSLTDTAASLDALAAALPVSVRRVSPYLTIVSAN
jgi:transmembrane sensor